MIKDVYMGIGSWDITLKPETPRDVRFFLDKWDHVVFTAGRVISQGLGVTVYNNAVFSGRLEWRERVAAGEPMKMGGSGILSWISDKSGSSIPVGVFTAPDTLTNRLADLTSFGQNGFSYTAHSLSGITLDDTAPLATSTERIKTSLDRWCGMSGSHYFCNPFAVVDVAQTTDYSFFPGDPTYVGGLFAGPDVVIGRGLVREIREDFAVYPINNLKVTEDWGDYWLDYAVHGNAHTGTSSAPDDGSTWTWDALTPAQVDTSETIDSDGTTTELNNYAARKRAAEFSTKYDYQGLEVDTGGDCLARFIRPGARFQLWDPETGQADNSTALARPIQSKELNPVLVQCTALDYPVTAQMGVTGLVTHTGERDVGSGVVPEVDLSRWIIPETGTTKIEVASRRPGLTRAITGRGR